MSGELIMFLLIIISIIVNIYFKRKTYEYDNIMLQSNLTGKEIAEKMLYDNNIYNTKIISINGLLSDHYNPYNKTVNLSHNVYTKNSILSAAIAAHECGHAVQQMQSYKWLNIRSNMVPLLSITNHFVTWTLYGGILMINIFPILIWIGILMFMFTTIFSFINLPIEFDASNKAIIWLCKNKILNNNELNKVKSALKWAAYTYVIASLSSLSTLLHYVFLALNHHNEKYN